MCSDNNTEKRGVGRPKGSVLRMSTVSTTIRMEETLYEAICAIAYYQTRQYGKIISVNEIMCEGLRLIVEKKSK